MTPTALILVTLSTFAHAFWNLLGKRRNPSAAFFLLSCLSGVVVTLPLVVAFRGVVGLIPASVWGLLALTGIFQAIYFSGLAGAYRSGDMSVAYPLARALPAVLVALVTALLGLGKALSWVGAAGILLVVAGCLMIPLQRFGAWRLRDYLTPVCALALQAACGTTGYTIIDSEALRLLRAEAGVSFGTVEISIVYIALETLTTLLALGVVVGLSRWERGTFNALRRSGWQTAALSGVIIAATYGTVLVAMAFVSNVSYLAAFRELSIPIGALLGIVIQKEPVRAPKLVGIGVVLVGLLLVALA